MTKEFLQSIAVAEAEAERIKADALEEAARITANAESEAAGTEKSSEEVLKKYRETQLKIAQSDAEKAYFAALKENGEKAKNYADERLKETELSVSRIVGRIVGGNR